MSEKGDVDEVEMADAISKGLLDRILAEVVANTLLEAGLQDGSRPLSILLLFCLKFFAEGIGQSLACLAVPSLLKQYIVCMTAVAAGITSTMLSFFLNQRMDTEFVRCVLEWD